MSEEIIKKLQAEVEQYKTNQKGLFAQLEARNQYMNESIASNLQLRTSMVIIQQSHQEQCVEIANLKNQVATIAALNDQIQKQGADNQALRDKIAALEAPKSDCDIPPPV